MAKAIAPPKRKAAAGYKLAERLPLGEIMQDTNKIKWKLGPSIGHGGFGEIYSAQDADKGGAKYPYVIKIEPHANGPLFVEIHFYMRNAKAEDIEQFKKERDLHMLGMPLYLGSGSHEYRGKKYRFLVMEKFGTDLWKIFLENNRIFPASTVFKIAIQILDVLEYIHSKGYVHADVKGANILMGEMKEKNKQVYLVDFGLATKYTTDTMFKPNPKKAHDGTIEYLSRDAHQGVQTRRGDLEILAYNMIHWLGGTLPWEKHLSDPKTVQNSKEEFMNNVAKSVKSCFGNKAPPGPLMDFLKYLNTLNFDSTPDYRRIRKIFLSGIEINDKLYGPLKFSDTQRIPQKRKSNNSSPERRKDKSTSKRQVETRAGTRTVRDDTDKFNGDTEVNSDDSADEIPDIYELRTLKSRKKNLQNGVTKTKGTLKEKVNKTEENGDMAGFTPAMRELALKRQQRLEKSAGNKSRSKK